MPTYDDRRSHRRHRGGSGSSRFAQNRHRMTSASGRRGATAATTEIDPRIREFRDGRGFTCPCCSMRVNGLEPGKQNKMIKHLGLGSGRRIPCVPLKAQVIKARSGDQDAIKQVEQWRMDLANYVIVDTQEALAN